MDNVAPFDRERLDGALVERIADGCVRRVDDRRLARDRHRFGTRADDEDRIDFRRGIDSQRHFVVLQRLESLELHLDRVRSRRQAGQTVSAVVVRRDGTNGAGRGVRCRHRRSRNDRTLAVFHGA
jgi:hypothetical protein